MQKKMFADQKQMTDAYNQVGKMSDEEIVSALKDPQFATRFAAAHHVTGKSIVVPEGLIPLLQDENDNVRQAARHSLVILSSYVYNIKQAPKGKSYKGKSVDFGPLPNATGTDRSTAVDKWTEFYANHSEEIDTLKEKVRVFKEKRDGKKTATASTATKSPGSTSEKTASSK